ncbi:MAG: transcriptional repressor [Saprospiraceae bacterium]
MTQDTDTLLKHHQLKITPFRRDVLQIFITSGRALSHQDLESALSTFDRITLYRTLKNFEDKGLIHKAIDGTLQQKFALCDSLCDQHAHHDTHVHFHCQNCQHTFCLEHVYVPKVKMPIGFESSDSQMVINGKCKNCSVQ